MGHIFVDESGDTGLKSRRFLVFGFVHCANPDLLRNVLRYQLKRVHESNLYPLTLNELKFTLPKANLSKSGYSEHEIENYENNMTSIRGIMAELVNSLSDGVFASAIDKSTIERPTWSSERIGNYIFRRTLGDFILSSVTNPVVYFDKGRLDAVKEQDFRRYLLSQYDDIGVNAVDSHHEPCIWTADFIAGAYYQSLAFGNNQWIDLISRKIGIGNHVYWR